jgi:hypothetical protein
MLNWTTSDLLEHIEEISRGRKYVVIDIPDSDPLYVLFKYPTNHITKLSDFEYDKVYRKAKKDGIKTEEDMMTIMSNRGIWTDDDVEKVNEINLQIETIEEKLQNPDLTERSKLSYKSIVSKLQESLYKVELKKEQILQNSLERHTRQAKYEYLVWSCSYDPYTESLLWENYLTFCNLMNTNLKSLLLNHFVKFLGGHTVEEVRYIARSNVWRVQFLTAQKANMPIFPHSVIDDTPDQTNLLWWAYWYQSIIEMMPEDRPDDATLDNDAELDKYMSNLYKERNKEIQDRKIEKNNPRSAMTMPEVLVMRENTDYLDLEYDKVKPAGGDKVSQTLADDPNNRGQMHKKYTAPTKSKKFTRPE